MIIGQPTRHEGPDDMRVWELPNGRYIYRAETGGYEVQPPNDNTWHHEEGLGDAIAWFAAQMVAS